MLDALKKNSLNIIECVYKQNKNLNKINSNKLCVLSIVTILNGKKVDVVSSSLKLYDSKNRSTSHVVRGVVDIKTGIINDYFVDEKGNSYTEYNDEKLIDFEIPMYKDAVDVATKCHDEIREILEVEWNFVLTNKDVYLVSANLWSDYVFIQNPSWLKNKVGLMPFYRKVVKNKRGV